MVYSFLFSSFLLADVLCVGARWARALKKYKKGVELIEHDDQFSSQEKKTSADIKKSCNLNLAATYLKVSDSKEARKACNKLSQVATSACHLHSLICRDGHVYGCGQG